MWGWQGWEGLDLSVDVFKSSFLGLLVLLSVGSEMVWVRVCFGLEKLVALDVFCPGGVEIK